MTLKGILQGVALPLGAVLLALGCSDDADDEGTDADRIGVASECATDEDCPVIEDAPAMECLEFKGGYCGLTDCSSDADCPNGSACVEHDDRATYCFRLCTDKSECNLNRSPDNQANCSSNVTFVEEQNGLKACVPPS